MWRRFHSIFVKILTQTLCDFFKRKRESTMESIVVKFRRCLFDKFIAKAFKMSSRGQLGSKKQLRFTFHGANATVPPKLVLQFAPSNAPAPSRLPPSSKSRPSQAVAVPKKPPPTGLSRILNDLHRKVSQKDTERIFAVPVTEDIAPGYFDMIKHPMDLSTIRQRLHDDEYQTLQQFRDDMYLMFNNCMTYNPPSSFVYNQGSMLLSFFRRALKLAKRQFAGDASDKMASSARTAGGPEAIRDDRKRVIAGVDIPTELERPLLSSRAPPQLPQVPDAAISFFHVTCPPKDGAARFDAFCDLVRRAPALRRSLRMLRERFPPFVLDDAACRIAGIAEGSEIDRVRLDDAIDNPDDDSPGGIGLAEVGIGIGSLNALAAACPGLPLAGMRELDDADGTLQEQNLRLMLFYGNCLQHWRGGDLNPARRAILDTIRKNITQVALNLTPAKLVKPRDLLVIQHINKSMQ
jgi:hypothetical protein